MKVKVNNEVMIKMEEYVKKHIPSIKHLNDVELTINKDGDMEFFYYEDNIIIQYCNTINHSYTREYVTVMSDHNILNSEYHKNQVIHYKNNGIRLITLFDITCNNHVWWNSDFELDVVEGVLPFEDLLLVDLFNDGYQYYCLDCRYNTYDFFLYKNKFDLVHDIDNAELFVWGKQNVLSMNVYYSDILKTDYHCYYSKNEQIRRVLSRGYYCFYGCGEQLLRLKK